jgi:flagellar basal-body rod protein FlgF
MIKGILTSGTGMKPMMNKMEVIANNLANINTNGFKRDSVFIDAMKNAGIEQAQGKPDLSGFDVRQVVDFAEGSFVQTNNPLDVGLQGRGFFVIDTPSGKQYTRNGNFNVSVDGRVVTQQGYSVAGINGCIQFPEAHTLAKENISVSETGEVSLGTKVLGKFQIVDFEDLSKLDKAGDTFFKTDAREISVDSGSNRVVVKQGYLEESNVDGIEEMIAMIELSRTFEASQRVLQSQDSTLDKTMEVGRI